MANQKKIRYVLGISGGKDSAALAIHIKSKYPEIHEHVEYFFCDTGAELPEVYRFLDKLEVYLEKKIVRLGSGVGFEHHLARFGGMLPDSRARWCTRVMKLEPFERFIGNDEAVSYIGIRADEHREGYLSTKPNIKAVFPFIEDGIVREDVFRILEKTVGVPEYYQWRSRSGCYFCFFQRKKEWVGLAEHHPELFEKAKQFEKFDPQSGKRYTWSEGESLDELITRASEIRAESERYNKGKKRMSWQQMLAQEDDEDPEDQACLICSL